VGSISGLLPEALTSTAKEIDGLFSMIFWITLVVFVLVEALLVIFLIRYKRKHPDKHGKNIHGNNKAEVIWTLVPAIILVFIGIYSSGMVYSIQQPPAKVYEVKVIGQKWSWEFEYENGAKTYGDLKIPAGRDVLFKITSKDVIHSFWIPEFRMKQDAVPGRETTFTVLADDLDKLAVKDGVYKQRIICAEYCGDNHSKMLADLTIMNGNEFDKWVAEEKTRKKTDGPSIVAANGCNSCHTIDGGKSVGPTWKGLFGKETTLANGQKVTVDEEYLKEAIVNPSAKIPQGFQNMMPAFDQLDEEQLNNLVKYIETLK
jgi:cytochrome c oxidase subunit II